MIFFNFFYQHHEVSQLAKNKTKKMHTVSRSHCKQCIYVLNKQFSTSTAKTKTSRPPLLFPFSKLYPVVRLDAAEQLVPPAQGHEHLDAALHRLAQQRERALVHLGLLRNLRAATTAKQTNKQQASNKQPKQ
jgi:hypothetical protein